MTLDYLIWSQILYELTFSLSGEQDLDKLIKKAATIFLKKLDCAQVSILMHANNHLETACAFPRVSLKDPAYHELIAEFEKKLANCKNKGYVILKKDLIYYGFPLPGFGLLLMGKSEPIKKARLRELLPITAMLAQNCCFNFESARKHRVMEAALEKERHLLRVIIDSIPDMIFYKDTTGVYKVANKAAETFLSLLPGEIIGHTDEGIHPAAEAGKYRLIDDKVIGSGHVQRFDVQYRHHDGSLVPFEVIKAPVFDEEGKCTGMVSISRDVTERKCYEQQLEYVSSHDQLTGLYNRGFLENEINRLNTTRQLPISIIIGDLNGLKLTNDVFGHPEGDKLLIKTAEIIKNNCRREDLAARWGGDEFVIFLPQTGVKATREICQKIKKECLLLENGPMKVSIALGCATKTRNEQNIRQVLKEASDKMYNDKFLNAQSYKTSVISSLKSALLRISMETEEHAERLKVICRKIGERMELSPRQLDDLELLAMLHDIGKVAIKKEILMKPAPLTREEWIQVKKHPEIGYRFARMVPELFPIAEYILSHHERWDGKGYPRGIKGETIPLLSRILAVADTFDALTNDRTYRKAINRKEALVVIKNSGKQFDPRVVRVFCQLMEEEDVFV